jgi:hypothetical protein
MNKSIDLIKKVPIILALIMIALLSLTKLSPVTTDADTHVHTIEILDREIDSVLKLSAGATGVSAAISLLPGDSCTPIANQFADLVKYFLVVLSALYLEKYLVTVVGSISFSFIVPVACVILAGGILADKQKIRELSYKLCVAAVALYCMIPLSVKASEVVYTGYESSLESTLDSADKISVDDSDAGIVEKFTAWIENAAITIADYVTDLLSRFIEAIAVMLVTSCLIPVLTVLLFAWGMKLLFGINNHTDTVNIKLTDVLPFAKDKED